MVLPDTVPTVLIPGAEYAKIWRLAYTSMAPDLPALLIWCSICRAGNPVRRMAMEACLSYIGAPRTVCVPCTEWQGVSA